MNTITDQKVESIRLTPTAWSAFPDVDEVRPVDDDDYAILAEIRDVLIKHNAINRFGVNLIHRHFDLNKDEVLFETTDASNRVQQMRVVPAAELGNRKNVLETQWAFDVNQTTVCVSYCHFNNGHKHIHNQK